MQVTSSNPLNFTNKAIEKKTFKIAERKQLLLLTQKSNQHRFGLKSKSFLNTICKNLYVNRIFEINY